MQASLWSTAEVAQYCGVTTRTVDGWCYRRLLPFRRLPNGQRRFRPADVDAMLDRGAVLDEVPA